MYKKFSLFFITALVFVLTLSLIQVFTDPTPVKATHSWGNYHWARTNNPFTLKLGDNMSSQWDSYLGTASSDWSQSTVLDTTVVAGGTTPKSCRPTNGRVEVCNAKYGNNGWLGIAQIWVTGDHIYQGVTKMNDTYFSWPTYNTPAWRQMVVCQEVGHTFGLDHQDINFDNPNLGTCMDYTSNPLGPPSNEHPNAHDYEELAIIYAHLDSFTTVGQNLPGKGQATAEAAREISNGVFDNPSDWGRQVKGNSRVALYERDFGGNHKLYTFVIWAE